MHGIRRTLLERQAEEVGLPLHIVSIPPDCPNDTYEARIAAALALHRARGVRRVAFGDLFLEDIRAYRESQLADAGMEAFFPVWGLNTAQLARDFIAQGFGAVLVCVDTSVLDASFAGQAFTRPCSATYRPASTRRA